MKKYNRAIRESVLPGFASIVLLSGCSLSPRISSSTPRNHAFIAYWPPAENSTQLKLAVKDNIDMKGVVTTAGSEFLSKHGAAAKQDAPCLAIARQRNVQIVGKTNMSEFAVAPSGYNEYFGTPENPLGRWRKMIPGGSSCGSAVAVASGLADVAFGTDTAGSVRVPAACCGIVGLKTTHGLISLDGVVPIEPQHLDTIGPLGRNIAVTAQGMDLLQPGFAGQYAAAKAGKPSARTIRIGRLTLKGTNAKIDQAVDEALARTGFQIIPLDDDFKAKWEQAKQDGTTVAAVGAWINNHQYRDQTGVSARTKAAILIGQISYPDKYREALTRQRAWQMTLRAVFKKVDFIALPTLQSTPPLLPLDFRIGILEARVLGLQNTVPSNFAGNPALSLPIPMRHASVPVTSLQLIGPRRREPELLNAGRLVETAMKE